MINLLADLFQNIGSCRNSLGENSLGENSILLLPECRIIARLITSFSISSMVSLRHARVFFSRFLGSWNVNIQKAAQVGGKSAVVLSGLMEASYSRFFIGRGFDCRRALLENVEPGKFILTRLQSPREWKNRTRLDEHCFFYYLLPPEDDS